jgi:hypothetical protein
MQCFGDYFRIAFGFIRLESIWAEFGHGRDGSKSKQA